AVGALLLDCLQIALDDTVVAQRTQSTELASPDTSAGGGELARDFLGGDLLIEFDQFASLTCAGVSIGPLNGRQFQLQEQLIFVGVEESHQRIEITNLRNTQKTGSRGERHQPFSRAQLIQERMEIAQESNCAVA